MFKHIVTLVTVSAILVGCGKPAESMTVKGAGFEVEKLFTHEDCTVYRFEDAGQYRYYTNCKAANQSTTMWNEGCGKNCSRDVEITSVGE